MAEKTMSSQMTVESMAVKMVGLMDCCWAVQNLCSQQMAEETLTGQTTVDSMAVKKVDSMDCCWAVTTLCYQ